MSLHDAHRALTALGSIPLPARLAALVARARTAAGTIGRPVLASVSIAVATVDPLAALDAAGCAALTDDVIAAALQAGRMYWAHPRTAVALAGLGAALTIAPAGPDRFTAADHAWRTLLADAIVDVAHDTPSSAGPLLFGGFAFEPDGPSSHLWEGFESTHLVVPALLVTTTAAGSWLTASVLVHPHGDASDTTDALALVARLASIVMTAPALPHATPRDASSDDMMPYADARPTAEWRALVGDAVAAINAGTLQKVVLARAEYGVAPHAVNVTTLLQHLCAVHSDAYVFATWRGSHAFVGASPERLVCVNGDAVQASSLAGSARRGATPREDLALAAELQASEKDRAEHALVRTALRRALARYCDDVCSADEPSLLTLPHVHHLHTAVTARLRNGHTLLELAGALHPTPAVGGEPRAPALAFLRVHEGLDRGWYAAPVGWIGRNAGELAVALRSALIAGREATLFAGCGIVAGSEPERELAESRVKLRPMQSALDATLAATPCAA